MYNFIMKRKQLALNILPSLSILYIEDDQKIRDDLSKTLELFFKEVFPFSNGEEAFEFYEKNKPDIILSDISLDKMSGIEFTKKVREKDKKIPIILLSAHTDTSYLLEAAKLKLVEYLTKPITFTQLENAFINAVNEIISDGNYILKFEDGLEYNVHQNILYKEGKEKKLTSSESKLLNFLIKNKHRTVTIEEIKNYIWDDPYDATETAFKSLLHKLRGKIGKSSIKNVSGIGYFLVTK